jgi:predicted nucleic acid-binding protein
VAVVVLDAGIVVAVLDASDGHHDTATHALRQARDAGHTLILPASAYAEVLVAPLRAGEQQAHRVDDFLDAVPIDVRAATRSICRHAARLRAEHGRLRLPDALVVATAIELDAASVVTTDGRWPDLGVRVQVA